MCNYILIKMPQEFNDSDIIQKLFDTYSIEILYDVLEKELGKEFETSIKILKVYSNCYNIDISITWNKALL